jgi:NAD+ kinase
VTRTPTVLVIPKISVYQRYAQGRKDPHFLRLLQQRSPLALRMLENHERSGQALKRVVNDLTRLGAQVEVATRVDRRAARRASLVVTVGGDGTLLDAAHWIGARPVLGVNSNPAGSVGYFCAATAEDFAERFERVRRGEVDPIPVNRMDVWVNGRRLPSRALNDVLFSHRCPAGLSEYMLDVGGTREFQRSSGVWFSTAAGSTGAIRAAGGVMRPVQARAIQYLVREPYRSDGRNYELHHGFADHRVELECRVFEGAVFIDGHRVTKRMGYGDQLRLELSEQPLSLYLF